MSATRVETRADAGAQTFEGVWCPVLTPLDNQLRPEPGRFVAHARGLLEQGCRGLVIFGTTGEATSFSVDERIELLEAALDQGLPRERLLVGTGCCALTDSVRLTSHALGLGVAGVLMLPPFYYKGNTDEALAASFDAVLQRVGRDDFKLFLYHFPKLSGVPITAGLIDLLRQAHPGTLAGVKDSSGDWENTRLLIERFPDLAIFPGAETLLLPALKAGGAGCITASANVNPKRIVEVYQAFKSGDPDAGRRQQAISATRATLQSRPMIPAMKFIIADARGDPAWRRVRPPLLVQADQDGQALVTELATQGFAFDAA